MKVKWKEKSCRGDCVQPLPPTLSESKQIMILIMEPESA